MLSWLLKRFQKPAKGGFLIPKGRNVPAHWDNNSWEEKARENPLFAVMTTPDLIEADPEAFSEEHLASFFAKGGAVFDKHVRPCVELSGVPRKESFLVEYGCGVGRILKTVVEKGYRCSGIDISATMLRHCRRLVPGVESLHALDERGRSDLPDGAATVVFSFAVVKHIATLTSYTRAVAEMCRLLKPRGVLALNVNCEDFIAGDMKYHGRTKNFETSSEHFHFGATQPYLTREATNWSGVYIGIDKLRELLHNGGVEILKIYHHNFKEKPQGIWVIGRKNSK